LGRKGRKEGAYDCDRDPRSERGEKKWSCGTGQKGRKKESKEASPPPSYFDFGAEGKKEGIVSTFS